MTAPSLWRRTRNTLGRSRRKHIATIDVAPDGFVFSFRRRQTRIQWADISRVDVGIRDYLSFDALYVIVFTNGKSLELDEMDDGFRQFEDVLFARWPQIRAPWLKLLAGNPREPQRETLWRRDG